MKNSHNLDDRRGIQDYFYKHPFRHFISIYLVTFATKYMIDDLSRMIWPNAHIAITPYFFALYMAGIFTYTQRSAIEKRRDKEAKQASKGLDTSKSE